MGVGGIIRGKKFDLIDGKNIVGRSPSAQIQLPYEGISKRHFLITIINNALILEDQGSSNGTFVNEKLVKQKYLELGDVISVPGAIFRLIKVRRSNIDVEVVNPELDGNESDLPEVVETDLWGSDKETSKTSIFHRMHYVFKTKIMQVLYEFNQSYEWHAMLVMAILAFVMVNIYFTIGPVLDDSRRLIVNEIKQRGKQYVEEVERTNAAQLSRLEIDTINDNSLRESSTDIQSYMIFDANGRVVRPVDKLNTYVNDSFAVDLTEWVKEKDENMTKVYTKSIGEGEIGVGKAITVFSTETQRQVIVGFVAIRFMPVTLAEEAYSNRLAYVESFVISCFAAFFFFAVIYYLTIRHLREFNQQIDLVQMGKIKDIHSNYLMDELVPLKRSVNSLLARIREFTNGGGDTSGSAENEEYYIHMFSQVLKTIESPAMLLDGNKNIKHLNTQGEDLLGIRESSTSGASLLDNLRDQGLAATILEVADNSSSNGGSIQDGTYEIKGTQYKINAVAVLGRDTYAKSFLLTFVKERS